MTSLKKDIRAAYDRLYGSFPTASRRSYALSRLVTRPARQRPSLFHTASRWASAALAALALVFCTSLYVFNPVFATDGTDVIGVVSPLTVMNGTIGSDRYAITEHDQLFEITLDGDEPCTVSLDGKTLVLLSAVYPTSVLYPVTATSPKVITLESAEGTVIIAWSTSQGFSLA